MPSLTLGEIAKRLGGKLVGADRTVSGIRPLNEAGPQDLTFFTNPRYRSQLAGCRAAGILAREPLPVEGPSLLLVANPYAALARAMAWFFRASPPPAGVDPRSALASDCRLGKEVCVGPFVSAGRGCRVGDRTVLMAGVSLGEDVVVGADSVLHPGVVVESGCALGDRVILHAGSVIGSDGFGFAEEEGTLVKMPQVGNVVVEEDVEIGANVTVDRATFGSTRIRKGTKIDNLVQIGHNCDIGEHSILVAQTGLSGSVRVGRGVIFAGQSGSVGHVEIGDGARVGAKSAVTGDLAPGAFVIGHPARDHREWKKAQAALMHLPELRRRVAALERALGSRTDPEEKD